MKTIHEILKKAKLGDILSDGSRTWKVVETKKNGDDCTVAVPHRWNKKTMGPKFELWDDAQARVTILPELQISQTI